MNSKKIHLSAAILSLLATSAIAQETFELDDIVISGGNSPIKAADLATSNSVITSDDINLLKTLKGNITWLNLSNCELKDEMLSTLSELPNLTRLRIQKNNLTDRGVPFLKNIKNLRELNIYGTQITDASFNIFSQMKNLEKIFLWNSKVSALGIEKFKTQNSTIEIISGL